MQKGRDYQIQCTMKIIGICTFVCYTHSMTCLHIFSGHESGVVQHTHCVSTMLVWCMSHSVDIYRPLTKFCEWMKKNVYLFWIHFSLNGCILDCFYQSDNFIITVILFPCFYLNFLSSTSVYWMHFKSVSYQCPHKIYRFIFSETKLFANEINIISSI